ncbi:AraC family transcriptional regulator [Robertkochia solimangrovi]|uniref:AraC family transcriptional regulator n=1 Tax=Robertkochia solimangrovi TaxID=2213046 RepID=UPI00118072B6|nr:AraC family transcriptional regulator [Robertkochia solimangrovi]TRZ42297.1 AraC family transcriptional regulator [Robertkochia solimangrovi]
MKLHFLDRSDLLNKSVTVHHNCYSNFLKVWHYHEQLELVYILKSTGTRFVGDNIEKFQEGEIILLGRNVPHMWLNDKIYFKEDSKLKAEAIAVHFREEFLGEDFFHTPEMKPLRQLLDRARRGLRFNGNLDRIRSEIVLLNDMDDFNRVIKTLEILNLLAQEDDVIELSSTGFLSSFMKTENEVLSRVYSYMFKNFKNPISLNEMAEVAHMNPSAFSRYFKKMSRKTFSRYLNEIRIGYACKLLLEQRYNITDICYESGFNNLSNFNRQFKSITSHSPTEYIKDYTQVKQLS